MHSLSLTLYLTAANIPQTSACAPYQTDSNTQSICLPSCVLQQQQRGGELNVQAHSSRHGGGEQRRYKKACGICIIKAVKITFIRAMRMNPRRQNLESLSLKHCGGRGQTWAFAVISPLWAGARRTFLTLEAQGDRDQRNLKEQV